MERGSAKHNPKLDEELKRETRSLEQGAPVESHVEEFVNRRRRPTASRSQTRG